MKNNIILKEYEKSSLGDLNSKDILEIEKINKLSKNEILEIKANNIIKAKQFVGVIRINNKNIQILPKIFGEENDKIIKNLLYMLSYTNKLTIKETDIANLGKINDLFEIFIYIFIKELINLLKKDFKKNYNIIEENSSFIKGKILFSQNIKNNIFNKSKFFIQHEKMDENFLLNIFLKSVCTKLIKITKSKDNYKLLNKCIFMLKDIDNQIFTNHTQLNKININNKLKEYKNIFSLGKMLYFGNSPDFGKNLNENFSFVFDMNSLFEEFITEFMKKNKNEINLSIKSIDSQSSNKYLFNENKFKLKPDIIINYYNNLRIIIDTKYKKLNLEKNYFGVSSADIYQMFVYGVRYFGDYNCENKKNIILLYPNYDGESYNLELNSIENINIFIKTIDLNFDINGNQGKKLLIEEIKNIVNI